MCIYHISINFNLCSVILWLLVPFHYSLLAITESEEMRHYMSYTCWRPQIKLGTPDLSTKHPILTLVKLADEPFTYWLFLYLTRFKTIISQILSRISYFIESLIAEWVFVVLASYIFFFLLPMLYRIQFGRTDTNTHKSIAGETLIVTWAACFLPTGRLPWLLSPDEVAIRGAIFCSLLQTRSRDPGNESGALTTRPRWRGATRNV